MKIISYLAIVTSLVGLTACQSIPTTSPIKFNVTSPDIQPYQSLSNAQVSNSFGCQGANHAPKLIWHHAPSNTQSFAITMYDPDAPTGSGFWHWLVVNIPSSQFDSLSGGTIITNDAGITEFLGACPPVGQKHRYIFTVYALDTPKLDVTAATPNAVVRFMLHQHIIDSTKIQTFYKR